MITSTTYHVLGPSKIERDAWVVYHPFSQSFLEVDEETGQKLLENEVYGKHNYDRDVKYFIDYIKGLRPRKIDKIDKPRMLYILISGICNLRCKYCYAFYGSYKSREYAKIMEEEVLEKIPTLIEEFNIKSVNFFGGEPLMSKNAIIKLIKKLDKINGVEFSINTNGTLLTRDFVEILRSYDFSVTVSLDGPRLIHNANRITLGSLGSFDLVMKGIKLLQEYKVRFGIEATYHPANLRLGITPYSIALYLSKFSKRLTVGLASNFTTNPELIPNDLHKLAQIHLGYYLIEALRELGRDDPLFLEDVAYRFVYMVTNRVFRPFSCTFFNMLSIAPNGDIFTCNLLITESKGRIGNLLHNNIKEINQNYKYIVKRILPEVLIKDYTQMLFEQCPLKNIREVVENNKEHLRLIYDGMLSVVYEFAKNKTLTKVAQNIELLTKNV